MAIDAAAFLARVKEKASKAVAEREVAGPPDEDDDEEKDDGAALSAGQLAVDAIKAGDGEAFEEAVLRIVSRN